MELSKKYFGTLGLSRTGLATGVVILVVLYLSRKQKRYNLPPGPKPWPIFGNIILMRKFHDGFIALLEHLQKIYGDIFTLHMGSYPFVILNNYQLVKEAFLNNNDSTDFRPNELPAIQKCTGGKGLVYQNGPGQRKLRKFAMSCMRDFGVGKQSLEQQIQEEAVFLCQEIETYQGRTFDPEELLTKTVSNVISTVVFGERNNFHDDHFKWFVGCLQRFFQTTVTGFAENYIPWLQYIYTEKRLKDRLAQEEELQTFLRDRIKKHENTYDENNIRDFVDLYIREKRAATEKDRFSEKDMARMILELYAAGTETTMTTLRWFLLFMTMYPDVQHNCRTEIMQVIGEGRTASLRDRDELPYNLATMREVMRVGNTAPSSLTHMANRNITLGGYEIPEGTIILGNLYACHMDPRTWEQPCLFKPERWIDKEGKLINREDFIPFSIGRRDCLGEKLARVELFLFSTALIQKFKFQTDGQTYTTNGVLKMTYGPQPFNIIAHPIQ